MLERLQPKSTLGRAALPVAGGLAFFGLLAVVTWGIAGLLSTNPDRVNDRLAPQTFEVGGTETLAALIADDGPLLFQGLIGSDADRSLVLDHTGADTANGWRIRYAFPADRNERCKVAQVKRTATFTDCEGRTLTVDELSRPADVTIAVGATVIIDLRVANAVPPATTAAATVSATTTG